MMMMITMIIMNVNNNTTIYKAPYHGDSHDKGVESLMSQL